MEASKIPAQILATTLSLALPGSSACQAAVSGKTIVTAVNQVSSPLDPRMSNIMPAADSIQLPLTPKAALPGKLSSPIPNDKVYSPTLEHAPPIVAAAVETSAETGKWNTEVAPLAKGASRLAISPLGKRIAGFLNALFPSRSGKTGLSKSDLDAAFDNTTRARAPDPVAPADTRAPTPSGLRPASALASPSNRSTSAASPARLTRERGPFTSWQRRKVLAIGLSIATFAVAAILHPPALASLLNSLMVLGTVYTGSHGLEEHEDPEQREIQELSSKDTPTARAAFESLKSRDTLSDNTLVSLARNLLNENPASAASAADILGDQARLPRPVIEVLENLLKSKDISAADRAANLLLANDPEHAQARDFLRRANRTATIGARDELQDLLDSVKISDRWRSPSPHNIDAVRTLALRAFNKNGPRPEIENQRFAKLLERLSRYKMSPKHAIYLPRIIREIVRALDAAASSDEEKELGAIYLDALLSNPERQGDMDLALQSELFKHLPHKIALALAGENPQDSAALADIAGVLVVGGFSKHPTSDSGPLKVMGANEVTSDTGSDLDYIIVTRKAPQGAYGNFWRRLRNSFLYKEQGTDKDGKKQWLLDVKFMLPGGATKHGAIRLNSLNFWKELALGSYFVSTDRLLHYDPDPPAHTS